MKLVFIISIAFVLHSCVKEALPECPYQYSVRLFVEDKNYNNSTAIGMDIKDENLPFREYVSNIYYTLQDINTGENVMNLVEKKIAGDEKEVEIIFDQIADGEYLLTVWGNVETTGNIVEDPSILHENKQEDTDEYIASETIVIKTGQMQTKSIGLERIKGRLVVVFTNLPDEISKIDETVSSLYLTIANNMIYSQETDVEKIFMENIESIDRISTFLAPSIEDENSTLSLSFYRLNDIVPILTIPPFNIEIIKNEITAVTINYDAPQNLMEIWVYIDNEWTLIQKLDISEI